VLHLCDPCGSDVTQRAPSPLNARDARLAGELQARAQAAERKATQVQAQAQAQPQAEPSQAAAAAVAPAPQAPPQGQPPQPTVEEALRHLMMTVENGSS
jgi:hypothetical protein